jgi:agmatinase
LQIDAHTDLRQEWNGSSYNHACVMRRLADDVKTPFVQVGIRSFSPEEAQLIRERGYTPFYAHEIDPFDNSWIDLVVEALPEMVYITLDLDGLDPSVIPGTGTPEPGGLSYRQVVNLIKRVGSDRKVVAADINELVKIKGSQVSEYTAAKLASKIIVYCVKPLSESPGFKSRMDNQNLTSTGNRQRMISKQKARKIIPGLFYLIWYNLF